MATMNRVALLVVLAAAAACGGKKPEAEEPGGPLIDTQATTGDPTDRSGEMIPPEKMEEITRLLDRRRMIVSRCLSEAVDSGELPKGARGKVTLEIVIAPSGRTSKVEVLQSTIDSPSVQGCVKSKVSEIAFPELPRSYETSYTYAMEVN